MTRKTAPADDDPWAKFRRLMTFMMVAGAATAAASLFWLSYAGVSVSPLVAAMVAGGVFLTVILAGALMGLVFVSNRAGIDESVKDRSRPDDD